MNAIEYFKVYGLSEAKRILNDARGCASVRLYDKYEFSTDDLKQIIDAFDRVMEHGSVELAKKYAESEYTAPEVKEFLSKAINLVEQCQ